MGCLRALSKGSHQARQDQSGAPAGPRTSKPHAEVSASRRNAIQTASTAIAAAAAFEQGRRGEALLTSSGVSAPDVEVMFMFMVLVKKRVVKPRQFARELLNLALRADLNRMLKSKYLATFRKLRVLVLSDGTYFMTPQVTRPFSTVPSLYLYRSDLRDAGDWVPTAALMPYQTYLFLRSGVTSGGKPRRSRPSSSSASSHSHGMSAGASSYPRRT